jgi:hypothetical protein
MPRRRTSVPPMRVQIAQIDHSMYPPRPIQDDMISVTTNQLEDERRYEMRDDVTEEQSEGTENCPEDFGPRLWQLFNRIQRRGTEPLFPADWQVRQSHVSTEFLARLFEHSSKLISPSHA